jgi:ATP adenylyltransferase
MNRLWAPWRIEYVSTGDKDNGCVFCNASRQKPSASNLVLYKGRKALVMLNKYPYTNAHCMVAPRRHLAEYERLTSCEISEMNQLTQQLIAILKKVYNPAGFNIGMNIGRAAGAGIDTHLHQHIVPRWPGDVNFMSAVAETRVISEGLIAAYERIAPLFKPTPKKAGSVT